MERVDLVKSEYLMAIFKILIFVVVPIFVTLIIIKCSIMKKRGL